MTKALAAEGKPHGIRLPTAPRRHGDELGCMGAGRARDDSASGAGAHRGTAAREVAALVGWIASAPDELVLNEAIVTPLEASGWP